MSRNLKPNWDGNLQQELDAKLKPSWVWRGTKMSVPVVLFSLYCFYGHSQQTPFRLSFYIATLIVVILNLGGLAFALFRDMTSWQKDRDSFRDMKSWQKGYIAITVVVLFAVLVCASTHFANFPRDNK